MEEFDLPEHRPRDKHDLQLPTEGLVFAIQFLINANAGLPHLRSLVNLKELDIACPHTTKDAANELRKALPSCSVHRYEKGQLVLP